MRTQALNGTILAAIATTILGCGSSGGSTLATAPIAKALETAIHEQRGVSAHVTCPGSVAKHSGTTFTCTAALEVGSYPITVTETNDAGKVRYSNDTPLTILNHTKVEHAIEASVLRQRHLHSLARCPAVVLQRAGIVFQCSVTVSGTGRAYAFRVKELDGAGHVQYLGV